MTKYFKFSISFFVFFIFFLNINIIKAASCLPDETCQKPSSAYTCVARGACPGANPGDANYQECCKPATAVSEGGILPAQTGKNPCQDGVANCGNYSLNDFLQLGVNVTNWILGIVGSLALLAFIYGGVMMLISEGSSDKVTKAKSIITGAVVGLVIVFSSYIIVGFVLKSVGYVNPNTGTGVWDIMK
ncbi:MAG: hypothetical protein UT48_C0001G0046 [Parcubacteria group bacterium GW2011_GWE2_39_37]|uniref:Uncharacterized protein n=1 Tax=Candidatus Falkowbacteria bacterium GW2011_GWF2_39_8 TaxID=1618642 RepID=A0A0G0Q0Z4_9BACT|nr:MAG: hypothetical protein UT48_C0001G0046 [Parcubacteria group bacterium GW2011_GWE2_39_37]KKR33803.1 MAG: hypothetical protein UT64_C0003G0024 [Candidatus Falkowbacteria bacterium GW2011_GWF2_39_8]